jgi:hypothetical protein
MASNDFRMYLDRAAQHLGSQVALARALGIDPTRISRIMKGAGDYTHLNFENCLRLAAILDEWPSEVLRAAGHTEQAVLVEHLYGPPTHGRSLKSSEWQLLQMWRELSTERQAAIMTLLKTEGGPAASTPTLRHEFSGNVRRRSGT